MRDKISRLCFVAACFAVHCIMPCHAMPYRAVFVCVCHGVSLVFHFTFDYYDIYTDHILSDRNAIMIDLFGLLIVSASCADPNGGMMYDEKVNKIHESYGYVYMEHFVETSSCFFLFILF